MQASPPSPEAVLLEDWLEREALLDRAHARLLPLPPLTATLLLSCLVWHLLPVLWGAPLWAGRDDDLLAALGARVRDEVATGAVWRLISALFLHASGLHLLLNLLALWILGRICEALFGPARLLFLFTASGLGASLLSQAIGAPLSVGASGAIFGLLGSATVFGLLHHRALHEELRPLVGRALLPWVGANLLLGLLLPGIDNPSHLGGLLTGALLTPLLQDRISSPSPPSGPRGRVLGALAGGLVLVAFGAMLRSVWPAIGP